MIEATEPDRATWHRVVAASGLDPALAGDIEAVATCYRAREGGDYELATAALRRAAHLTPAGPRRSRRFAAAAGLAHEIGGVEVAEPARAGGRAQGGSTSRGRPASRRWGGGRPETLIALAEQVQDRRLVLKLLWHAATELQALGHGPVVVVDVPGTRLGDERRGLQAQDPVTPGEQALLGYAALVHGHVHRSAALLAQAAEGLGAQGRRAATGEVLALAAWAQLSVSAFDDAHASAAEAAWLAERTRAPLWGALAHAGHGDHRRAARRRSAGRAPRRRRRTRGVARPRGRRAGARPARARDVGARRGPARRGLRAPAADVASGRPGARSRRPHPCCSGTWPRRRRMPTSARSSAGLAAISTSSPRRDRGRGPRQRLVLAEDDDADAAFASAYLPDQGGAGWPFTRARVLLVEYTGCGCAANGAWPIRGRRCARPPPSSRRSAARRGPSGRGADCAAGRGLGPASRDGLERLTPRELEIAGVGRAGADQPLRSPPIWRCRRAPSGHHLARIFPKLDVASRAGVGAALERHGYGTRAARSSPRDAIPSFGNTR